MEEEYMMMMDSIRDENTIELPPGYCFCPTKQELLKYYLYNKVVGEDLPVMDAVVEKTLYGREAEEPSQIFAGSSEEYLYFLTLINKKFDNVNGKKMNRVAGKGRWEMQSNHPVYDDPPNETTVIGYDKTFNFYKDADKKNSKKIKHGNRNSKKKRKNKGDEISWIMHEYCFDYAVTHKQQAEWTICKIRKKIISEKKNRDVSMPESKRARTSYTLPPKATKISDDARLLQKDHNQHLPSTMPHHQKTDQPCLEFQPCTHLYDDSYESRTDSISRALVYTPFAGVMSMTSEIPNVLPEPIQTSYPSPHNRIDDQSVYNGAHNGNAILSLDDFVQLPSLQEDDVYSLNKVPSFTEMLLIDNVAHNGDAIISLDDVVQLPSLQEDDVYSLNKVLTFTEMLLIDNVAHNGDPIFSLDDFVPLPNKVLSFTEMLLADDDMNIPFEHVLER
ncbi:hypothetical protein FRX31_012703 [Thalictrum thalictroides]|uniref:NAC domain-containing protein n=1 Tax=Thalictrum thalictroides TaxID=46969 RepID=A0A7J6WK21_THATH|nr:hypothetical protein FRX31_012703 [Thalictrum thalictroides]